jgi:hypothetical protein
MDSSAIEGNSEARKLEKQVHPRLSPDEYYYSPEGFLVFTETYHLNRGYCCKSQCRHCPYQNKKNGGKALHS